MGTRTKRFMSRVTRLHAQTETHVSQHAFTYFFLILFLSILVVSFVWGYHAEKARDVTPKPSELQAFARGFGRSLTFCATLSILLSCKAAINGFRDNMPSVIASVRIVYPGLHVKVGYTCAILTLLHVMMSTADYFIGGGVKQWNSDLFPQNGVVGTGVASVLGMIFCYVVGIYAYRKHKKGTQEWYSRSVHIIGAVVFVILFCLHGAMQGSPFSFKIILPTCSTLLLDHLYRLLWVRWHVVTCTMDDFEVFESVVKMEMKSTKSIKFKPGQFFRIHVEGHREKVVEAYTISAPGDNPIYLIIPRDRETGNFPLPLPFPTTSTNNNAITATTSSTGARLHVVGPFGTPMTAHKYNARHVFIASDLKSAIPIISIVRSLIPYLPKVPPHENPNIDKVYRWVDKMIAPKYEWEPHIPTISPDYDPFSLAIEPDPEIESQKEAIDGIEYHESAGDIMEALGEVGEEVDGEEKKLPMAKRVVAIILKLFEVEASAEEHAASAKDKKGAMKVVNIFMQVARVISEITTAFFPKSKSRKKKFLMKSRIVQLLLRLRSILMLLFNSVKVSFLILLAGVIRYDLLLCTIPASEEVQEVLQIFEMQIAAIVSGSLTAAVALEISVLGKEFFESPGGWLDLFIIIPVIVGSWAYSVWSVRTEDSGEDNPIKHLTIQLSIILPAKLILLMNRLARIVKGKEAEKGAIPMKQKLKDSLSEQRDERKKGIVQRIDVVWVTRPEVNDNWYREEARKLVGKRVRFIPFYPQGIENETDALTDENDQEIKGGKFEFEGLNWGEGLRKMVWETQSNGRIAVFFSGRERMAKRMERIFRRYETWSQIRGGYIRTHLDKKLKEMVRIALGKQEELKEMKLSEDIDSERIIVMPPSSIIPKRLDDEKRETDEKSHSNVDENEEARNEDEEDEEVNELVERLRTHGNFVFFGYRRGTFA